MMTTIAIKPLLFLCVFISLSISSSAQTCDSYVFVGNRNYRSCTDLPGLNSFLHWNYTAATGTVDIAYRRPNIAPNRWIAWAINPNSTGMLGSQALVAYQRNGVVNAYTSQVTGYIQLQPSSLTFDVPAISGEFRNNEITIFATISLSTDVTSVNQVWQEGPLVSGSPGQHALDPANTQSRRTLNLQSGQTTNTTTTNTNTNTTTTNTNTTTTPTTPTTGGSVPTQTCNSYVFSGNRNYRSCTDLPGLNSFLHWNYTAATGTVDIAYRRPNIASDRWISWAINPNSNGMVGSQALVAYQRDGGMTAYTSQITGYGTQLQPSNLTFDVPAISGEFRNNEMTIFATIRLSTDVISINQVWQEGPLVSGSPGQHALDPANRQSRRTLNLQSGQTTGGAGLNSIVKRRNIHGVLNAVGWGTLMPLGAIVARYLRVFKSADPAWFYLHIGTQSSAYIIGVAGWATGLKLGSDSPGITYTDHRNIGIVLFTLGTIQLFALLLRPKPDHKYRLYWNIYHHSTGYTVIILSIVNIFKGFDILDPEKKWKRTYIGVLIGMGAIAVVLEAFTWMIVLKRKKAAGKTTHAGTNGVNGYGARPHNGV